MQRKMIFSKYRNQVNESVLKRFCSSSAVTFEEIRIPVPWGTVAGKWWGRKDKRPILCIHGWQDNSGTYDTLIPLLPKQHSYLALDYPGHGLSSQLPKGMFYHYTDVPIFFRRIQNYFGWSKLSFLGHSMGAITSFLYTSFFPTSVDVLIAIDFLKPFSFTPGSSINKSSRNIDLFLKYDALNNVTSEPPTYTLEEMKKKLHEGSRNSIDTNKCQYILKRLMKESATEPNKFIFTRDPRLKVGALVGMQHSDIVEHAKKISCPVLALKATEGFYLEDKKFYYDVVDVMKSSPNFHFYYVKGSHHVHLNEPQNVAGHITEFLRKYYNI